MGNEEELIFLKPEQEYKVLVTVEYPDELWEWCERQGGDNPNGYIFKLIREDMQRKGHPAQGSRP